MKNSIKVLLLVALIAMANLSFAQSVSVQKEQEIFGKEFLAGAMRPKAILKVISVNEKLMLRFRDGSRIISSSEKVFSYIDPDFKNYGADEKGKKTKKTEVVVHKTVENASFAQMFGSLDSNTKALCLTQDQILEFIETHRRQITNGYATFFLFKSSNQFFVAGVLVENSGTLWVNVYRLEYDNVWKAKDSHRVVVPQLTLGN